MDSFQNHGTWWVPGTSDRISGKVEYTPHGGIILKLNSALPVEGDESETELRHELAKEYSRIYGDLGQDGAITIEEATMTSASFGPGADSEKYAARRLILGEQLPEDSTFTRLDFYVDEIPQWTNSALVRSIRDTDQLEIVGEIDDVEFAYAATTPTNYTAEMDDIQVKLENFPSVSSHIYSVEMETLGVLRIIPDDEADFQTLFDYGTSSMEYLSFAAGSGVYPEKIQLRRESHDQPLDLYYAISDFQADNETSPAKYLFRPGSIDFEASLENWLNHQEEAPEVYRNYRLLLHRSQLSPHHRFLANVIALEAFYDSKNPSETLMPEGEFEDLRSEIMDLVPSDSEVHGQIFGLLKHVANSPSIKSKLLGLMEEEVELFDPHFDIDELASDAREHRNRIAHGSTESSPITIYILSEKLELVLEGLIAREIGVPAENLPNPLANRHRILTEDLGEI